MAPRRSRPERGQATVEVAVLLPLIALLVLIVVQVGLVVTAKVVVVQAARDGARLASVEPDPATVVAAVTSTSGLDPARLEVEVGSRGAPGTPVSVTVRYRPRLVVPGLAGRWSPPQVIATVTMPVE